MTIETTPSSSTNVTLCCYEGCDRRATERDSDGDLCCERCYWQRDMSAQFVELHNLTDGNTFDADMAERYSSLMAERGWNVEVREPNRGEAEGHTYYRKDDGTLQILTSPPEAYAQDARECFDAVCSGRDRTESEEQAREDIAAAFAEWDREYPLRWTEEEMIDYWTRERSMDERDDTIRARAAWATAIERLLPTMLETERKAFEQRAAAYHVARVGLPGTQSFSYTVHEDVEAAHDAIEASESDASRSTARDSAVMTGSSCLWDTWQDGRLIYRELVARL